MNEEDTSLRISKSTRDRLKNLKIKYKTYDEIINFLLDSLLFD